MKNFIEEFKKFLNQGNAIELAIGVVESIWVGFKGGAYRLVRFNQDGRAESVLYFTPSDEGLKRTEQKMLYGFDGKEELAFFLHLIDGKGINTFLVREQNDYVEGNEEARAKKLMDEAMNRARLFRCENCFINT